MPPLPADLRIAVQSALSVLGTAKDIREACAVEGVKGLCGSAEACVLAILLGRRLGPDVVVTVLPSDVIAYHRGSIWPSVRVSLTGGCKEAVRHFDSGDWPELIFEPEPGKTLIIPPCSAH